MAAVWIGQGGFFGGDPAVQVWAFGPLAAGFAAILVLALGGEGASPLSRVLSGPALRGVGKYSYGLYVLHYPAFLALEAVGITSAALALRLGGRLAGIAAFVAIAGAVTFAGAFLSWHGMEKRFLRWKDLVPYGRAPAAAGAPGADGPECALAPRPASR